ncbi:phage terminase small subunit P27 family, partial [Salmonella enterica subsp. enterica serovar Enteritidis]|nr:phage terminase small subunit P27 family [Salmonella enterica subsp. enterica serovar Enteritidis]
MGAVVRSSGGGRKRNLPSGQKSKLPRSAPPEELMSDIANRIWKTQSNILIEPGVFDLEDAPLHLAYCNAFHLMIAAEKVIAEGG